MVLESLRGHSCGACVCIYWIGWSMAAHFICGDEDSVVASLIKAVCWRNETVQNGEANS